MTEKERDNVFQLLDLLQQDVAQFQQNMDIQFNYIRHVLKDDPKFTLIKGGKVANTPEDLTTVTVELD